MLVSAPWKKTDLYTQEDGIVFVEMLYADYRLPYFVAGTKGMEIFSIGCICLKSD